MDSIKGFIAFIVFIGFIGPIYIAFIKITFRLHQKGYPYFFQKDTTDSRNSKSRFSSPYHPCHNGAYDTSRDIGRHIKDIGRSRRHKILMNFITDTED